jgi:putative ATP-dependent endonuclease of OLD family
MKLSRILIENFRGIKNLDLVLGDTTVLIGENNSGKTAVMDALRLCLRELGPRRRVVFDPYDFYLKDANTEPEAAGAIRIELLAITRKRRNLSISPAVPEPRD